MERLIRVIRGQRVMVDRDLAALYGVETHVFNQAVRRNRDRFPDDFTFQLSREEAESLGSQFVISNQGGGGAGSFTGEELLLYYYASPSCQRDW